MGSIGDISGGKIIPMTKVDHSESLPVINIIDKDSKRPREILGKINEIYQKFRSKDLTKDLIKKSSSQFSSGACIMTKELSEKELSSEIEVRKEILVKLVNLKKEDENSCKSEELNNVIVHEKLMIEAMKTRLEGGKKWEFKVIDLTDNNEKTENKRSKQPVDLTNPNWESEISIPTQRKEEVIDLTDDQNTNQKKPEFLNETGMKFFKESKYEQAFYYFKQAADQGHAPSQHNLGVMYSRGEGVELNLETALCYFKKAADQGDAPSQYNLGVMYSRGEGVELNLETALYYFKQAAYQGHELAIAAIK